MRMSILSAHPDYLRSKLPDLIEILEKETYFGVGVTADNDHSVMEEGWDITDITKRNKIKAHKQLGTSGGGNHFVEFGVLRIPDMSFPGLAPGTYTALLSHSGSRGAGHAIAAHYSKLAQAEHPNLPKEFAHLAWLDLDSDLGKEYWAAMELMGRYSTANHELIHDHIIAQLPGCVHLLTVENHHNFAYKEQLNGEDVVIHRKGATPAHKGTLGVIPGSMATPGFVVMGTGNARSLNSASHGAGRCMSRTRAKQSFDWEQAGQFIADRGVHLISGGLDEVPMAYKDIHTVMAAQSDLVDILAEFNPSIVKMAEGKGQQRR